MKRSAFRSAFFSPRVLIALLLCAAATGLTSSGTPLALSQHELPGRVPRTLTLQARVSYQRAIEEVYWRHRIWPTDNHDPKPALDAVISRAELEKKVQGYLRDSLALKNDLHRPITAEQLQVEMDRMAQHTKQPEVLRELFEVLENDPFVVAECLVRPVLSERLLGNWRGELDRDLSQRTEMRLDAVTLLNNGYSLPTIAAGTNGCTDDTWTATAIAPFKRDSHTAVWTGTEMIVWGGAYTGATVYPNTGGRYNPTTDSWTATSTTNAPSGRWGHTAVWTGNEMIIWAGVEGQFAINTGARYNPVTNSWTATSTNNAPVPGIYAAVWTGSQMIVWGGPNSSGGKYNPNSNNWTAISNVNAPSPRAAHTAVWTGSEMIVWGGTDGFIGTPDPLTGGRYDPSSDSWTATSTTNVPLDRYSHTAVWTGTEMIVWGGINDDGPFIIVFNDGGKYNPTTNSWTATATNNAPSARTGYTATWSGSEMIIWGGNGLGGGNGFSGSLNTGGKYNPVTNTWTATRVNGAPTSRDGHTAVWIGRQMIAWGGDYNDGINFPVTLNTGGKYCAPLAGSQLGNLSTRAFVQTGDNVMIGGFIVQGGPQTKRVIIRAIGPELTRYGVPNVLADPILELHDSTGALIASNDNWLRTIIGGIITTDQVRDIRNSGLAPTDPRESAIIADLSAGNYTAIVRGVSDTMGIGLVEVYDLSPDSNSILGNISTRSLVQADDNVMIGGFIIQGTQQKKVIVRAIGPELGAPPFNIPNALANPSLELHDGLGARIASNDNWQRTIIGGIITTDQRADIRNSGHAPTDGRESAIVADLPPGNYTAIVHGVNNTTGIGLVEVYDLGQ